MSDSIKSSRHERRVGFHGDAPAAKFDYKFAQRRDTRFAGQIWEEKSRERGRRLRRERALAASKNEPMWFDATDVEGPDEDYGTREYITYRHDRYY